MVPGRQIPANGVKAAIDKTEAQPVPAAGSDAADGPQRAQRPHSKSQTRPNCPQCGLQIPETPSGPGGSSLSVHSSNSKKSRSKGGSKTTLNQSTENTSGDVCFNLLLSCLFCHCSALLLGLLDLCSLGFSSLCFGCADGCNRCCSSVEGVPVEELSCHTHCHSVLVQSCCEPTEFLEFCLECCQICHRS